MGKPWENGDLIGKPWYIKAGWWCNVPILKNYEVKVNGVGMTSHIYEMEHKTCLKPPTSH
jgi:hypothetical protein